MHHGHAFNHIFTHKLSHTLQIVKHRFPTRLKKRMNNERTLLKSHNQNKLESIKNEVA
jgi:hypothetical protein